MPNNILPKMNILDNKGPIHMFLKNMLMHENVRVGLDAQEHDKQELLRNLNEAKKELDVASKNFEFAEDEQMVDFYIYRLKAAETKYQYLLKQIKEKGIVNMDMTYIAERRR